MDGGAWKAVVHGVAEGQTRLRDFTFTFYFHALEKEMATHSSVLAWRIPGTAEPGGLPSMGSHRVEHNWSDLAAATSDLAAAAAAATIILFPVSISSAFCVCCWLFVFLTPHISETMQDLSFCVWLTSLSIISSSFIHVVVNDRISFFLKAE